MFVEAMLEAAHAELVTIPEGATLIESAKLLSSGTDIVVVCDDQGSLQGVITKTDVVKQISICEGATCMCPVAAVMTRDAVVCRGTDAVAALSTSMKERGLKNIPAVDGQNRPVGVITARAVLGALLSDAEFEEARLIDYVKGVGYR